jgi:CRISPR-associated protein Csy2
MSRLTIPAGDTALLVLPHLQVQNANAISGPFTHGFPSITAFTGMMWALQRKLNASNIPLKLHQVGVICHHHEEQVSDGYVKTFRLTRNPVNSAGQSAAIVEEGRMHLDITLLFEVTQIDDAHGNTTSTLTQDAQFADWAARIGDIVACMRIAGGTLLPARDLPMRSTRPWIKVLSENHETQAKDFARWSRRWLPGFALVGRDDLLKARHDVLRETHPESTLLDAWLHASRFNFEPPQSDSPSEATPDASKKKQRWIDPFRQKGGGWTVPIPVGYAALTKPFAAGSVTNARDASTPFVFVESVYSFGEWISPHRLTRVQELLWRPESDLEKGLYRCYSGYQNESVDDDLFPYE